MTKVRQQDTQARNNTGDRHGDSAADSVATPSRPGALRRLQRSAGNLAMGRFVQTKLRLAAPADPLEQEADHVAARVLRMNDPTEARRRPSGAGPRVCPHCGRVSGDPGGCPECRKLAAERAAPETLLRSAAHYAAPPLSDKTQRKVGSLGSGRPLPRSERTFFEPRFGRDLSGVRIHSDPASRAIAHDVGARAFTIGNRIGFGTGEASPESPQGRKLMAHELVHVVQQTSPRPLSGDGDVTRVSRPAPTMMQRELDPANEAAWGLIGKLSRDQWATQQFVETLSAAAGKGFELQQEVNAGEAPSEEAGREAFAERMETLVRLNALGLMASHWATMRGRSDEVIQSFARGEEGSEEGATRSETMVAVRSAASRIRRLREVKEELEDYRRGLAVVEGLARARGYDMEEWGREIYENTKRFRSSEISRRMRRNGDLIQKTPHGRGYKRMLVASLAEGLVSWREEQIKGIDAGLYYIYEAFPFFTHLDADDVSDDVTNDDLEEEVRQAIGTLLRKIDNAILDIGSGDIHPFDLPEAVRDTRDNLTSELRPHLDAVLKDHKEREFWLTMGLTLVEAALVFIPVVGPVLAAGVGIASVAAGVENLMDRLTLSQASADPEGKLLGVDAPGRLDWAMLAVEVALTAFDLGMLARELRAGGRLRLDDVPTHEELDAFAARSAEGGDGPELPEYRHGEIDPTDMLEEASFRNALGETHELHLLPDGRIFRCSDYCREVFLSVQNRVDVLSGTLPPNSVASGDLYDLVARAQTLQERARNVARRPEGLRGSAEKDLLNDAVALDKEVARLELIVHKERRAFYSKSPEGWPVQQVTYDTLPRDSAGNIEPLHVGTVYEFPGGHRAWRIEGKGGSIAHESYVGPGHGRQDFEKEYYRPGETDLSGQHRAHSLGQGTGFESPFAIPYAPKEVNLRIQNDGIEEFMRGLRDEAPPGMHFHLRTETLNHPRSLRLKEITYRLEYSFGGQRGDFFELTIEVGGTRSSPRLRYEVSNMSSAPEVLDVLSLVDVPERVRQRFARWRRRRRAR